jgi:hypothetical protein
MRSVTFLCPLCQVLGRRRTLVADLHTEPLAPTVINLEGCEHADGFGHLDKLTREQEWQLIEAALTAESDDAG